MRTYWRFNQLLKSSAPEDLIRDAESDLQEKTNKYIAKIEQLIFDKNKEIFNCNLLLDLIMKS